MNKTQLDDYLDFPTFLQRNVQFKLGQLRWLVAMKKKNGLETAFHRIGRRLYIHVPTFLEWVRSQKA